jgi:hypothetical protein
VTLLRLGRNRDGLEIKETLQIKKRVLFPPKVHCNEVQCAINTFFVVIVLEVWLARYYRYYQTYATVTFGKVRIKSNFAEVEV